MSTIKIELAEATILQLEPGDVLVIQTRLILDVETAHRIYDQVRKAVGEEIRILVMDQNTTIAVLRPGEDEDQEDDSEDLEQH